MWDFIQKFTFIRYTFCLKSNLIKALHESQQYDDTNSLENKVFSQRSYKATFILKLASAFIYELILIQIYIKANAMKTHI